MLLHLHAKCAAVASTGTDDLDQALTLLRGPGGTLARYLLPERLVALSRRLESKTTDHSQADAGSKAKHFASIGDSRCTDSLKDSSTCAKQQAEAADASSRRATRAVAATQVIPALAPHIALGLAQSGFHPVSHSKQPSGPSTDAKQFMSPIAVERAIAMCLELDASDAKWASSFAGGAEKHRSKSAGGKVTGGKGLRRLIESRSTLDDLRKAASAAKPPIGIVAVRREVLSRVRFEADLHASSSGTGK